MRPATIHKRSGGGGSKRFVLELLCLCIGVVGFLIMISRNHQREQTLLASIDAHEKDKNSLHMIIDELKQKQSFLQDQVNSMKKDEKQFLGRIETLTREQQHMAPVAPTSLSSSSTSLSEDKIEGVAIVCCLDGPGWLQNRYSMSVLNILEGLPKSWRVQLFHKGSAQSLKGIAKNRGLNRMIQENRIIVTELQGEWAKRSRSELYLSPYFWRQTLGEKVLMFGHGGVLCHNSPYTLENFTSYDLCASNDGGFVILKKQFVIDWLTDALPEGEEYMKKIHGPVPYMIHSLRKQPNINIAPPSIVENFVLNTKSSWTVDVFPLAISGTLSEFSADVRKGAIEKCPEIKMVFPSLDNPACFGASSTLDKEACINSLCVSNPKQGGC